MIPSNDPSDFNLVGLARRTAVVMGVVLALSVLIVGIGYVFNVLLLAFAGLILAILIRIIADFFNKYIGLPDGVCVAVSVLILASLIAGTVALLAPNVAEQIAELQEKIPQSAERAGERLKQLPGGDYVVREMPSTQELLQRSSGAFGQLTGILSSTLGALASLVVIIFLGIYLAAQPNLYIDGINRLAPISKRDRTREVMLKIGSALRLWLLGKLLAMVLVGVLVWLALMFLGVPFALTLGVIAAVFTFIPNFGPVISATPAILLGLTQSPMTALWVLIAFVAIQALESYVITPMIQQRAVSMPPALLITSQLILGVFVGLFGLALAAPLGLTVMLLVRFFYVHDLLGDSEVES